MWREHQAEGGREEEVGGGAAKDFNEPREGWDVSSLSLSGPPVVGRQAVHLQSWSPQPTEQLGNWQPSNTWQKDTRMRGWSDVSCSERCQNERRCPSNAPCFSCCHVDMLASPHLYSQLQRNRKINSLEHFCISICTLIRHLHVHSWLRWISVLLSDLVRVIRQPITRLICGNHVRLSPVPASLWQPCHAYPGSDNESRCHGDLWLTAVSCCVKSGLLPC